MRRRRTSVVLTRVRGSRVSATEVEEAPDKTAAERSQTGDRPLRCPPAQK
jgi:hypothetical protein